jgi:ABC-type glycerol-3-phosphate transport system permease component
MAPDGRVGNRQLRRVAGDALLVLGTILIAFPIVWIFWTAIKPAQLAYQPSRFGVSLTLESFRSSSQNRLSCCTFSIPSSSPV